MAWGGRGPCKKKKNFPLGYEEKINWPPNIRQLAPLPISHLFSRPQSKIKNTLKLKKKKKKLSVLLSSKKKKKKPKKN